LNNRNVLFMINVIEYEIINYMSFKNNIVWEKQQMETDFCSHRLANLALSGHSIEFHNKTNTKTIVTVHKPQNLHYNPIKRYRRRALSCEKTPDVESIAKKHFSTMKDTTIIPHSRSPFDRNFSLRRHRAPFGWISDFSFYVAGKRSSILVLPSMKRLFPLL